MKRKAKRYQVGGLNPYQGDDVDYFSGVRNASGAISRNDQIDERDRREMAMAEMAKSRPARPAAKAPIVTKEQMKKAGFDNLRDYLNAQRGLTRRGAPAQPKAEMGPSKQDIDRMEAALTASNIRDERRAYEQDKDAAAAAKRAAAAAKERESYMKEQARKKEDTQTGSQRLARKAEAFRTRMREQATGMKSGGMVASKRADGIAQRGKTRGRII
jgi:hypothetical protein